MKIPASLPVEKSLGFIRDQPGLFPPNATTRSLASTAADLAEPGDELLDLGCGSGLIGFHIAQTVREKTGEVPKLSMSDVSEVATQVAARNAGALGIPAEVRQGWILDPWKGQKFDLIVSDISAVVPAVAELTDWFNGAPNESGADGTALAVETLVRAGGFLNERGRMLVPVLSVSNESVIITAMEAAFRDCKIVGKIRLPMGPLSSAAKASIDRNPHVRLEIVNGVFVFEVAFYCLRLPRGKNG